MTPTERFKKIKARLMNPYTGSLQEDIDDLKWLMAFIEPKPSTKEAEISKILANMRQQQLFTPDSYIQKSIRSIEAIIFGNLRTASTGEMLGLMIDFYTEKDVDIPKVVSKQVATILPHLLRTDEIQERLLTRTCYIALPWCEFANDWHRFGMDGVLCTVRSQARGTYVDLNSPFAWRFYSEGRSPGVWHPAQTLHEAKHQAELGLGRYIVLNPTSPEEIIIEATVDAEGYIVDPDPGEEPELQPRPTFDNEDGDICAGCQISLDVTSFLRASHRFLRGEMQLLCQNCVTEYDDDEGWG